MPTQCATKPLEFEGFGRCCLLAKKLIFLSLWQNWLGSGIYCREELLSLGARASRPHKTWQGRGDWLHRVGRFTRRLTLEQRLDKYAGGTPALPGGNPWLARCRSLSRALFCRSILPHLMPDSEFCKRLLLVFLSVPSWSFVPLRGYFLSFLPLLGQLLRDLGVTSCPSHRSSGPGCSHPPAWDRVAPTAAACLPRRAAFSGREDSAKQTSSRLLLQGFKTRGRHHGKTPAPPASLKELTMQLALDPLMHCDRPLPEVVRLVADLGWENLELCSRDDFFPEYWPPRADKTRIREFKQALHQTGMSLVSLLLTYRWASPRRGGTTGCRPLLEKSPPHRPGDRMSRR